MTDQSYPAEQSYPILQYKTMLQTFFSDVKVNTVYDTIVRNHCDYCKKDSDYYMLLCVGAITTFLGLFKKSLYTIFLVKLTQNPPTALGWNEEETKRMESL